MARNTSCTKGSIDTGYLRPLPYGDVGRAHSDASTFGAAVAIFHIP